MRRQKRKFMTVVRGKTTYIADPGFSYPKKKLSPTMKKYERCVREVSEKQDSKTEPYNAYAVCKASVMNRAKSSKKK